MSRIFAPVFNPGNMAPKHFFLTTLLSFFCLVCYTQTYEGHVFEVSARVKIFLPQADAANLEGTDRYIQIGMQGAQKDVHDLVGYMDRFIVNDHDMITRAEAGISEEGIDYYKFYLDPLYDANDFQHMLEMLKITRFNAGVEERPVTDFSNLIYSFIKSKNHR